MVVGNTVLDSIEITAEGGGINIVELQNGLANAADLINETR